MTPEDERDSAPPSLATIGENPTRPRRVFSHAAVVLGALRLHFFALPAAAVLAGASSKGGTLSVPVVVAAVAASLGWGGGQLLNDLLDVAADAVDAPDRAGPRGLLAPRPTLALALTLGIAVTLATVSVHPDAEWLAVAATALLLGYGPSKRHPALGNAAHGALISVATFIGAAAAMPDQPLPAVLSASLGTAALSGTWAALYLQANYEKDRRGDRAAGYRTLAHVLGLRASAGFRVAGAMTWAIAAAATAPRASRVLLGTAAGLVVMSALRTILGNTETAALGGYRYAVHGAMVGLWALASPILSLPALALLVATAAVLVELAFRQSPNP